jgi:hypothetical protein
MTHLKIGDNVYNGTKKVNPGEKMFQDAETYKECKMSLKSKNSEGHDRIPQRVLIDRTEILIVPFTQ